MEEEPVLKMKHKNAKQKGVEKVGKKLNGRNTVGMLRDDILDEFCKKHCPNM